MFVDAFRRTDQDLATVCMVTHDGRYSDLVDRRITLFDGRIVSQ
jgi:ABC-type lipoprotein export system ATPase subunit